MPYLYKYIHACMNEYLCLHKSAKHTPTLFLKSQNEIISVACCVEEMSLMLACWKRNDFKQELCSKELMVFEKCVAEAKVWIYYYFLILFSTLSTKYFIKQ